MPSTQNNPYAKVVQLWVAYSATLQVQRDVVNLQPQETPELGANTLRLKRKSALRECSGQREASGSRDYNRVWGGKERDRRRPAWDYDVDLL